MDSATIRTVSTHVLDTASGVPAAGVPAVLSRDGTAPTAPTEPAVLGRGTTDADGRIPQLNDEPLEPGDYRVTLDVADHMHRTHGALFHPTITVHVRLDGARPHYHLPVLAAPYSYTTYLGS
jgi:5-hydroxyisourate hydrolase